MNADRNRPDPNPSARTTPDRPQSRHRRGRSFGERLAVAGHAVLIRYRLARRWLSRRQRTVRLLGLPEVDAAPGAAGVILLQIDGLSRRQLERAVERGKMPFVQRLLRDQDHRLETFYSGLPSTTPAVQAELFYGIAGAVPAFAFRDAESGATQEMIQPSVAASVESRLASRATGLLSGGSAYSNIYSGGAAEPHFCAAAIGAGAMFSRASKWRFWLVLLWNLVPLVTAMGMLIVEFFVAITDFFRGILRGRDFWAELKLVPSRMVVAVLLRELIAIGAEADATRGVPIIHANFLGYDEQAHGRNPDSAMAHWSLRQIDGAVRRICDAARASSRRHYQVWIYSDHGQESTIAFEGLHDRSLEQIVGEYCRTSSACDEWEEDSASQGVRSQRAGWLGGKWRQEVAEIADTISDTLRDDGPTDVTVVAKGPLGHIYLPQRFDTADRHRLAGRLAAEAEVPWVFVEDPDRGLLAWHRQSRFELPRDLGELLGPAHPFADTIWSDLIRVCRHSDAGDLVVAGWQRDGPNVSFVRERGAHAGVGPEETRGFIMVPTEADVVAKPEPGYWRPALLRDEINRQLGRVTDEQSEATASDDDDGGDGGGSDKRVASGAGSLRLMTYNVHSCVGTDGRLSIERIVSLIRHCDPDVVALHEVDVGREATGGVDQAAEIADRLGMSFHFEPAIVDGTQRYGNAILSRLPFVVRHGDLLPQAAERPLTESRSCSWVTVETGAGPVQLLATHLGLDRRERLRHVDTILGPDWIGHPDCDGPVILCGDFNSPPGAAAYRRIGRRLNDAQRALAGHVPLRTWMSGFPILRIDHVFVSPDLDVTAVQVPNSFLARVASDHRPLVVDVRVATDS